MRKVAQQPPAFTYCVGQPQHLWVGLQEQLYSRVRGALRETAHGTGVSIAVRAAGGNYGLQCIAWLQRARAAQDYLLGKIEREAGVDERDGGIGDGKDRRKPAVARQ